MARHAPAHRGRIPSRRLRGRHVGATSTSARWDPIPVDEGAPGIQQMVGNGWEWTSTVFAPFPGFQPFPFYPNYSEPFFDGQHYVLKGRFAANRRVFSARVVPELVPPVVSLHLRRASGWWPAECTRARSTPNSPATCAPD